MVCITHPSTYLPIYQSNPNIPIPNHTTSFPSHLSFQLYTLIISVNLSLNLTLESNHESNRTMKVSLASRIESNLIE